MRKFARELGADLGRIGGTGPKGRITQDDVKAHVKQILTQRGGAAAGGGGSGLPKVPEVDFAKFGAVEVKPLSRIQRISGARLQASWLNLPHVTQNDEADITDLEAVRAALKDKAAQEGVKLTPLVFIIKACIAALQKFPRFNASLDASGENLVLKKYFHIGFAADTPNGLVVPVVRDADRYDIFQIARVLGQMSEKARAGKLTAAEMQGGSFTVSSLGGIGGTAFTPIINAPEVAILGVARSSLKPAYERGGFIPRLDAPAVPFLRSSRHRRCGGGPLHRLPEQDPERRQGAGMSAYEVRIPDLGDAKGVTVVEVLVAVGAAVKVDDPLVTLETEKASMDVPAPVAGVIESILVKKGDGVAAGTPIATLTVADADQPAGAARPDGDAQPARAAKPAGSAPAAAPDPGSAAPLGAPRRRRPGRRPPATRRPARST